MTPHRTSSSDAPKLRRLSPAAAACLLLLHSGCFGEPTANAGAAPPASPSSSPVPPTSPSAGPSVFDGTLNDGAEIPELSTADFKAALADPAVVVLDARPFEEYAVSHVPGARSVPGKAGLPASQYTADVGEILRTIPDRSRPLIVYCNGLYCGRSKRFGADLRKNGYTHVRRYQLGIPGWRALGGVTQVEKRALVSLLRRDATAVLIDARERAGGPKLADAKPIQLRDAAKAKDDGRLPMNDHNTRIFVVGDSGAEARAVAEAIVRDAFHNVSFYAGRAADVPELAQRRAR